MPIEPMGFAGIGPGQDDRRPTGALEDAMLVLVIALVEGIVAGILVQVDQGLVVLPGGVVGRVPLADAGRRIARPGKDLGKGDRALGIDAVQGIDLVEHGAQFLGIAGGVVGGYILALAGVAGSVGGLIGTCITALIGALLLIWLSNRIKVKG